jgi:hypothetical protein
MSPFTRVFGALWTRVNPLMAWRALGTRPPSPSTICAPFWATTSRSRRPGKARFRSRTAPYCPDERSENPGWQAVKGGPGFRCPQSGLRAATRDVAAYGLQLLKRASSSICVASLCEFDLSGKDNRSTSNRIGRAAPRFRRSGSLRYCSLVHASWEHQQLAQGIADHPFPTHERFSAARSKRGE